MMWVLRQQCDRTTLAEKQHGMHALVDLLTCFRDMMYVFRETIPQTDLVRVAVNEIPFLWPNDRRLAIPEGDQIIAKRDSLKSSTPPARQTRKNSLKPIPSFSRRKNPTPSSVLHVAGP